MEIYTGIDIVDNRRIKRAVERFGERFLSKIFTKKEISYCLCKKNLHECLSARFAAKEAFIKAFYQAFQQAPKLIEIEIAGKRGKPAEIFLHSKNLQAISSEKPFKTSLSISHEKEFSVAVVVLYVI